MHPTTFLPILMVSVAPSLALPMRQSSNTGMRATQSRPSSHPGNARTTSDFGIYSDAELAQYDKSVGMGVGLPDQGDPRWGMNPRTSGVRGPDDPSTWVEKRGLDGYPESIERRSPRSSFRLPTWNTYANVLRVSANNPGAALWKRGDDMYGNDQYSPDETYEQFGDTFDKFTEETGSIRKRFKRPSRFTLHAPVYNAAYNDPQTNVISGAPFPPGGFFGKRDIHPVEENGEFSGDIRKREPGRRAKLPPNWLVVARTVATQEGHKDRGPSIKRRSYDDELETENSHMHMHKRSSHPRPHGFNIGRVTVWAAPEAVASSKGSRVSGVSRNPSPHLGKRDEWDDYEYYIPYFYNDRETESIRKREEAHDKRWNHPDFTPRINAPGYGSVDKRGLVDPVGPVREENGRKVEERRWHNLIDYSRFTGYNPWDHGGR